MVAVSKGVSACSDSYRNNMTAELTFETATSL